MSTPSQEHRPPGIPNGWFAVAWSKDLADGEVKRARYFDQELVIFRTRSGTAVVLDAYCPHLGAHLGYGGKVVGDTLRCPFHAWRYDSTGQCIEIPYAVRIPPKARIPTWPVVEKNGFIMVWYHGKGEPPAWEIPDIPEYGDEGWTPWERRLRRDPVRQEDPAQGAPPRVGRARAQPNDLRVAPRGGEAPLLGST